MGKSKYNTSFGHFQRFSLKKTELSGLIGGDQTPPYAWGSEWNNGNFMDKPNSEGNPAGNPTGGGGPK